MTDRIVKCDWRYFSVGDLTSFLSTSPIERSIQFKYDQHVVIDDALPLPDPVTPEKDVEMKPQPQRKKIEKPLSRKEKKAAAKKQMKEDKTPKTGN